MISIVPYKKPGCIGGRCFPAAGSFFHLTQVCFPTDPSLKLIPCNEYLKASPLSYVTLKLTSVTDLK